MAALQVSDEALLRRLRGRPDLRERVISILEVVEAEEAGLKRADDVEDRLVEQLRRLGQEAMQSWANTQVELTEHEQRCYGGVHREGKKNSAGTRPLATSTLQSLSTAVAAKDCAPLRKARA